MNIDEIEKLLAGNERQYGLWPEYVCRDAERAFIMQGSILTDSAIVGPSVGHIVWRKDDTICRIASINNRISFSRIDGVSAGTVEFQADWGDGQYCLCGEPDGARMSSSGGLKSPEERTLRLSEETSVQKVWFFARDETTGGNGVNFKIDVPIWIET